MRGIGTEKTSSRSIFDAGRVGKANEVNEFADQASLLEIDRSIGVFDDVNTEITSKIIFFIEDETLIADGVNDGLDFSGSWGSNETIVNVDNDRNIVAEEETGVLVGGLHTDGKKSLAKVKVPETRTSFVTVDRLMQLKDGVIMAGHSETRRKFHVDRSFEGGLHEGGLEVNLGRMVAKSDDKNKKKANGRPVSNWSVSVRVINIKDLAVARKDKTSLEFDEREVGAAFLTKGPLTGHNLDVVRDRRARDNGEAFAIDEVFKFRVKSFFPHLLFIVRKVAKFPEFRIIGVVLLGVHDCRMEPLLLKRNRIAKRQVKKVNSLIVKRVRRIPKKGVQGLNVGIR